MLPANVKSRPKSASNFFVNIKSDSNNNNPVEDLSEENRFRTYNVKDLKMAKAKAYLPEELIREFQDGFEASAKSPSTSKSRNFVRKLVATLENKMTQGSGHCTADDEFLTKRYSRPSPSKNHIPLQNQEKKPDFSEEFAAKIKNLSQSIEDDDKEKKDKDKDTKENFKVDEFLKHCSSNNLYITRRNDFLDEKLCPFSSKGFEKIKEEIYNVSFENFDFRHNFHQPNNEIDLHVQSDQSSNISNIYAEPKSKRSNSRLARPLEEKRSFKNVLSSIFKSRNKPTLPKGKRNILSSKESLGEEMRLFRRDMMPVLLRARPYNNDFEKESKDDTFSSIIAASKSKSTDRSASIHPIYGGKKGAPKFLKTLEEDLEPQDEVENRRFQRQEIKSVIPREESPPLYERPPDVIYDVPKSNKMVSPASNLKKDLNLFSYENSAIFSENSWNRVSHPVLRKNIVCGKRALFLRKRRLENQF